MCTGTSCKCECILELGNSLEKKEASFLYRYLVAKGWPRAIAIALDRQASQSWHKNPSIKWPAFSTVPGCQGMAKSQAPLQTDKHHTVDQKKPQKRDQLSVPGSQGMAKSQTSLQTDKHHIIGTVDCARLIIKLFRKKKNTREM
jgi:hypothetical protein